MVTNDVDIAISAMANFWTLTININVAESLRYVFLYQQIFINTIILFDRYNRLINSSSYFFICTENSEKVSHSEGIRKPSLVIVPPLTPATSVFIFKGTDVTSSSGCG